MAMAEVEPMLSEATPPGREPSLDDTLGDNDKKNLKIWWDGRWKRYTENRFGLIMPLWLRTRDRPVDNMDKMKKEYSAVYAKVAGKKKGVAQTDNFAVHVKAVIQMLGHTEHAEGGDIASAKISEDACAKILAEMDQRRSGAVDGQVDLLEATRWWSQYTDDESLLLQAWEHESIERDSFGNIDLQNLAKLIGLLLRPTEKEARLAVWAAFGDGFGQTEAQPASAGAVDQVDQVAAWLMSRGEAGPRDKARITSFLTDKSAISSIFAEDADGPSEKDEALQKATKEQDPPEANTAVVEVDDRLGQYSVFDHFFDQWMRMHRTAKDANFVGDDPDTGKATHPEQRLLTALRVCPSFEAVIEKLLEPTEQGLKHMTKQIDFNDDGHINKTEVRAWWKKNCSPDVRAFERAWLQADKDCDDELSTEELKSILGFEIAPNNTNERLVEEANGDAEDKPKRYSSNPTGLRGLQLGETSTLVKSLDDDHQPAAEQDILAQRPAPYAADGSEHQFAYTLRATITRGTRLQGLDRGGTSDPYVVCKMSYSEEAEKALAEAKDLEDKHAPRESTVATPEPELEDTGVTPEPEPEDAGVPEEQPGTKFYCQFGGKGEFVPVLLSLNNTDDGTHLEVRQDSKQMLLLREADVSGCKVAKPKHERRVSQLKEANTVYARRIDMVRRDSEGDVKYIIATKDCQTLDTWISMFYESQSKPPAPEECKRFKKLYRELIAMRKLAKISYCAGNIVEAADAYTQAVDLLSAEGIYQLREPKTEAERAQDRQSENEASSRHQSESPDSTTMYLLEFTTGDTKGAGTDSGICVTLFGKKEGSDTELSTGEMRMPDNADLFETGQVDQVQLRNVKDVGELTKITVRTDDKGWGSSWLLDRVVVRRFSEGIQKAKRRTETRPEDIHKVWTFPCKKWLENSMIRGRSMLSVDLKPTERYQEPSTQTPTVQEPGLLSKSQLLCGRARCWRQLALRDDKSPEEMTQLWSSVRNDAAGATEGLQHKDTTEADQLHAEAVRKLRELTSGIAKVNEREGEVHCQFAGKGPFKKVHLSLQNSIYSVVDTGNATRPGTPPKAGTPPAVQTETTYELEFKTGSMHGAGTDAKVFVTLFGTKEGQVLDTGRQEVKSSKKHFEKGTVDRFPLENVTDVGELTKLTVEHDGTGFGAGWYLESVSVTLTCTDTDVSKKALSQQAHFPCHRWLDEAEGDGEIRVDLFPESPGVLIFTETETGASWAVDLYADIKVSEPKHPRDGYSCALKLDLGSVDSMGHKKYVIAADCEDQIASWRAALSTYGTLQSKAEKTAGHKVLHKIIKGMNPQKTRVIKKTNDAYWDETFTFEWSCTRRELNLLQLEIECVDSNMIGMDTLIGNAPPIAMMDVFERIGTPECYSQPKTVSLLKTSKSESEAQSGYIDMYVVLEENLSRPVRATLYPTYMDEKYLSRHVQVPGGDSPSCCALDVCLLGLRGLKEELRQPSVEIIVNGVDQPSVVDTSFSGMNANKFSRYREPYQSKRLYTVGGGLNPSLADFTDVKHVLSGLSPGEIKRRAILAGVLPPTIHQAFRQTVKRDGDGDGDSPGTSLKVSAWRPSVEDLLQCYENVQFSHPNDKNWYPKSLTIRIWHKPLGSKMFAKHQPAELYAQACIPLIRRKPSQSATLQDEHAQKAIRLYHDAMHELHTDNDGACRKQSLLHPSGSKMQEIRSELGAGGGYDRLRAPSDSGDVQQNSKASIDLLNKAKDEADRISDPATKTRLLTKLYAGIREAKLNHKFNSTIEEWQRGREILEGTWESSGSTVSHAPVFSSWELFDASRLSPLGSVRCAFRLGDTSDFSDASHEANTEWKRVKQKAALTHVVVRVYVVSGRNLRAMDRNNKSDPYVTCTLTASGATKGSTERQTRGSSKHRVNGTLNPEFRQVFEFNEILMPGCAHLRLSVKDWDALSLDDDIGYTDIDLEHRYLCNQWNALEHKPLETRALTRKSRKQQTYGNGSLLLWVDIIPTSPTSPLPPPVDISLPDQEKFQLRVVVWNAEDMKDDAGSRDDGGGQHMNDLYFSGHLRSKKGEKIAEMSQETDVHWRAKGGIGEFNYRFVYDFAVDPQLPVKQPCSFTLKAWDKDPLSFKSDFLGQRDLNLSNMVEDAMLLLREQQKHDEKIKLLVASGRIDEMLVEVQKYRAEQRRKRAETKAKAIQLAKERIVKGLNPEGDDGEIREMQEMQEDRPSDSCLHGCVRKLRNCCSVSRKSMAEATKRLNGGSPEDRAHTYKWDHARQWKLRDIEGTHTGTVWVSVELLHQSISKKLPVGKGRDAPNEHPVLQEPEREHLSLTNPLGALRYFVGPARLKIARLMVVMAFFSLVLWTMLSTWIDWLVRLVVIQDLLSVWTMACPDGSATPSAVHTSFCGGHDKFKPQIDHWLKCLGPYATLSGLDSSDQPVNALCRGISDQDGNTSTHSQHRFNWELCEQSTKTCNPGLQRQLDTMQTMTRERQQTVFDQYCEIGGSHYNLVMYSPNCHDDFFRAIKSCDNEPCRTCVSATDGFCTPEGGSSFLTKLVWRVLVPALLLRLLLITVTKFAKARSLHGSAGLCSRMRACQCFSSVARHIHCKENCNHGWARFIRKLVTWTLVLFVVVYATILCDDC